MLGVAGALLLEGLVKLLVEQHKVEELCAVLLLDRMVLNRCSRECTLKLNETRVVSVKHRLEHLEQRGRVLEETQAREAVLERISEQK